LVSDLTKKGEEDHMFLRTYFYLSVQFFLYDPLIYC